MLDAPVQCWPRHKQDNAGASQYQRDFGSFENKPVQIALPPRPVQEANWQVTKGDDERCGDERAHNKERANDRWQVKTEHACKRQTVAPGLYPLRMISRRTAHACQE